MSDWWAAYPAVGEQAPATPEGNAAPAAAPNWWDAYPQGDPSQSISVKMGPDNRAPVRDYSPSPEEFAADDAAIAARNAKAEPPNLAHTIAAAGSGVNEGIAGIAGLPVDFIGGGVNLARRGLGMEPVESFVGGSDWLKQRLADVGIPDIQPQTPGEQFAKRTAQDVGAAVLPFGAVGALAKAGIGTLKPIVGPMIQSFRAAPMTSAASNAGLSAAGGAGAATAQQIAPGSPTAETIGGLAGGVGIPAATMGAARLAGSGINAVRSIFPTEANAGKAVAGLLRQSAQVPDTLLERSAAGRNSPVEGFKPTLGQATNDPGILSLERGVARDPAVTASAQQHRAGQNQALAQALREALPTISDDQIAAFERRVAERVKGLGTGASPDVAGQILREELASQKQQLVTGRAEMSGHLYEQAANDAARQREVLDGLKQLARDAPNKEVAAAIKEIEKAARLNPQPAMRPVAVEAAEAKNPGMAADLEKVLKTFARKGTSEADYTASGLMSTSKALGQIAADYTVHPHVRGIAKQAQRSLDGIIAGEVPTYRAARAAYREGSPPINAMEEGPVGKVLAQDHLTKRFDTPDSAVAEKFFNSRTGAQEAAQDFMKTVGGRGRAIKAMEDYIAGQALDPRNGMIDAAGKVNARALRRFLADHEEALQSFPSVASKMRNVKLAQETVDTLQGKRDLVEKLTRTLIRGEEANPDLAVASFNNFVRSNRAEIERLLPGRIDRLEQIGEEGLRAQRTDKARQKGGSDTNEETRKSSVIGTMISTAAKEAAPMVAGGVLGTIFGGALGGALGGAAAQGTAKLMGAQQKAITTLLGKALLDPEVAETLLMRYRPASAPVVQARIRAHLAGIPLAATGDRERNSPAAAGR